jgi:hypothetical protein
MSFREKSSTVSISISMASLSVVVRPNQASAKNESERIVAVLVRNGKLPQFQRLAGCFRCLSSCLFLSLLDDVMCGWYVLGKLWCTMLQVREDLFLLVVCPIPQVLTVKAGSTYLYDLTRVNLLLRSVFRRFRYN